MPSVPQVEACLNELGLCFCFAPLAHPAMKNVAAVRKQLGIRTIFNILGPLVNPAGACFQLLGAGRPELRPLLAGAMARLGTRRALVVSGEDGLGDVTLTGTTYVTEVTTQPSRPLENGRDDCQRDFTWQPEDFGIARASVDSLTVDGPTQSAAIIRNILAGAPGTRTRHRDSQCRGRLADRRKNGPPPGSGSNRRQGHRQWRGTRLVGKPCPAITRTYPLAVALGKLAAELAPRGNARRIDLSSCFTNSKDGIIPA